MLGPRDLRRRASDRHESRFRYAYYHSLPESIAKQTTASRVEVIPTPITPSSEAKTHTAAHGHTIANAPSTSRPRPARIRRRVDVARIIARCAHRMRRVSPPRDAFRDRHPRPRDRHPRCARTSARAIAIGARVRSRTVDVGRRRGHAARARKEKLVRA